MSFPWPICHSIDVFASVMELSEATTQNKVVAPSNIIFVTPVCKGTFYTETGRYIHNILVMLVGVTAQKTTT
jgi:hypothetical protein